MSRLQQLRNDAHPYRAAYQEFVASTDVCTLTTRSVAGELRFRPMSVQEYAGGHTIWFVTDRTSRKVDDIRANDRVSLSFANSETHESATFHAIARIVESDHRVRQWFTPTWKQWLAPGDAPAIITADDPRFALIEVRLLRVTYVQSPPRSRAPWFQYTRSLAPELTSFDLTSCVDTTS